MLSEDTADGINLLFVTEGNFSLFFFLTADHFHSEVSAEAPGREVQL